ncbi:MAG: HlyC/CorC family transporter [Haliscomenobacter sp.]|nr:HlyC/CorC family transporter [Haliscomenobacter sp.]
MELLIIVSLVLLNGVFAMAEMALVSSRKFKLESALKKGNKSAKTALELSGNPTKFLSTVQIGITLIGILLGVYSGENLTKDVETILLRFGLPEPYTHTAAVFVVVLFVTYLSIVLGELLPKRIALIFPEPIAMVLAWPMRVLSILTSPFVWLLTTSNDLILKVFGIKDRVVSKVTEEEIKSIIKESADGGEIQGIEQNIVERVFELGDRRVNSLMTHRANIVYFDVRSTLQAVREIVRREKHSAYPVCKHDNLDNVQGIALLKDLFEVIDKEGFSLANYLKRPLFVNEAMPAYRMLELFKKEKLHYAIVVDEFGATKGIVTMDDVLDALVGDILEQGEAEYEIRQRDERSWFVDGQFPISDFLKYFNLPPRWGLDGHFVTVAGLLLAKSHALPQVGDKFEIDGYSLEVVDKDGQRIDKILVVKI